MITINNLHAQKVRKLFLKNSEEIRELRFVCQRVFMVSEGQPISDEDREEVYRIFKKWDEQEMEDQEE